MKIESCRRCYQLLLDPTGKETCAGIQALHQPGYKQQHTGAEPGGQLPC